MKPKPQYNVTIRKQIEDVVKKTWYLMRVRATSAKEGVFLLRRKLSAGDTILLVYSLCVGERIYYVPYQMNVRYGPSYQIPLGICILLHLLAGKTETIFQKCNPNKAADLVSTCHMHIGNFYAYLLAWNFFTLYTLQCSATMSQFLGALHFVLWRGDRKALLNVDNTCFIYSLQTPHTYTFLIACFLIELTGTDFSGEMKILSLGTVLNLFTQSLFLFVVLSRMNTWQLGDYFRTNHLRPLLAIPALLCLGHNCRSFSTTSNELNISAMGKEENITNLSVTLGTILGLVCVALYPLGDSIQDIKKRSDCNTSIMATLGQGQKELKCTMLIIMLGSMIASMYFASRTLFLMGKNGLFFRFTGAINVYSLKPTYAVMVTAIIAALYSVPLRPTTINQICGVLIITNRMLVSLLPIKRRYFSLWERKKALRLDDDTVYEKYAPKSPVIPVSALATSICFMAVMGVMLRLVAENYITDLYIELFLAAVLVVCIFLPCFIIICSPFRNPVFRWLNMFKTDDLWCMLNLFCNFLLLFLLSFYVLYLFAICQLIGLCIYFGWVVRQRWQDQDLWRIWLHAPKGELSM